MDEKILGPLIVAIVVIIIASSIIRAIKFIKKSRQQSSRAMGKRSRGAAGEFRQPPVALGVPQGHPAFAAAERLEAALDRDFEERVKNRVQLKEPGMKESDWQWRWFELKRYFLMCGVLRHVPMYSSKVDVVWHEMLMFTREYEQFCHRFCGAFIHHAPHAPGAESKPSDRAWFDWIYGELFAITPPSERLWGSFYRTPLANIEELQRLSPDELRNRLFNTKAAESFTDLEDTITHLITRGKKLADEASSYSGREPYRGEASQWADPVMMTGVLSGALFFSSMGPPESFEQQMAPAREEQLKSNYGGSGVACSGGYYNDDSDSDSGSGGDSSGSSGSDSSGGDSGGGGSSCSSGCGGGCSS